MKANELMIGDWVCVTKNFTQKYHRIRALSNDKEDVLKGTYINNYGVECNSIFSRNDIEPIPLTPEILEKNGFKKCARNEWSVFKYEDDDYTKKALYQVLWSSDELYLEIASYTSRTGEFNRLGVEFVHELQHALRLCGIEKTIEL